MKRIILFIALFCPTLGFSCEVPQDQVNMMIQLKHSELPKSVVVQEIANMMQSDQCIQQTLIENHLAFEAADFKSWAKNFLSKSQDSATMTKQQIQNYLNSVYYYY